LLVRPAPTLAGLLEVRGLGIRRLPFEPIAVVGTLLELGLEKADRMPEPETRHATIDGVQIPRLAVAAGSDPLGMMLAYLLTRDSHS
jgi:serine kinase of HPr protein (carbohydrate metabolism regulator)